MITLKSPREIEAMREAGRAVAAVLADVTAAAAPGVTLRSLDERARAVLAEHGATSTFLGYQPGFASIPFPAVICASVNDAALHGIPGDYALRSGDVLSIDCGADIGGWAGDAAVTITIGQAAGPSDTRLVGTTRRALEAGIAAARAGGRLGDISHAIGVVGRSGKYGLSTDFGGHGIGEHMHEEPSVPNEGRRNRGLPLRPGLVLAIEPWFMAGGRDGYRIDDDGWTLRSADGSRAAHFEHTVAITEDGPQILTLP
jgi:methionyl aminopeptidase